MELASTNQILPRPSASKITSSSPYFSKDKFLSIVNPMLLSPEYFPGAILIISFSTTLFNASFKVRNAVASLFPSPPGAAFTSTYQTSDPITVIFTS